MGLGMRDIALVRRVWCLHLLFQIFFQPFLFVWMWKWICAIGVGLAFRSKVAWQALLLLRCCARIHSAPFVWDSEWWCMLTDLAIVAGCSEATIGAQWSALYAAAGIYKLNQGFLDPRTSCASIFSAQLVQSATLAKIAPLGIVSLEIAVGWCLWTAPETLGVPLCLLFHAAVALTPPPNGVPTFSLIAATRCVMLVVDESTENVDDVKTATVVATAFAAGYGLAPSQQVATGAFFAVAALTLSIPRKKKTKRSQTNLFFVALALAYASLPIFGLMDIGAPTMFGGLKVHGGSNHLFLPTGLLQRWFAESNGPFGGGVVRVEATSSAYLAELFPGEIAIDDQVASVLRDIDGLGREFAPKARRIIPASRKPISGLMVPYTVPFFELRRLVYEAPKPFNITFSRLNRTEGDENWRRQSMPIYTATLDVREDGRALLVEFEGEDPTEHIAALGKHTENGDQSILVDEAPGPLWARKLLLFAPYAVVPGTQRSAIPCNY